MLFRSYANAGQSFTGKVATGLVGIHDGIGRRQCVAWQVMVSNEYAHARRLCCRHTVMAGNAVIDRDDKLRLFLAQR